jgi:hypothetical protein
MKERTNNELLLDIWASAWVLAVATLIGGLSQWLT